MNNDSKILLRQALHEIRAARHELSILRGQRFVVEAFHAALCGRPNGGGMGPDLLWEIERHLEQQKQEPQPSGGDEG